MVLWGKVSSGVYVNIVVSVHGWLGDIGGLVVSWIDNILMRVMWASIWDVLVRVSVLEW